MAAEPQFGVARRRGIHYSFLNRCIFALTFKSGSETIQYFSFMDLKSVCKELEICRF